MTSPSSSTNHDDPSSSWRGHHHHHNRPNSNNHQQQQRGTASGDCYNPQPRRRVSPSRGFDYQQRYGGSRAPPRDYRRSPPPPQAQQQQRDYYEQRQRYPNSRGAPYYPPHPQQGPYHPPHHNQQQRRWRSSCNDQRSYGAPPNRPADHPHQYPGPYGDAPISSNTPDDSHRRSEKA